MALKYQNLFVIILLFLSSHSMKVPIHLFRSNIVIALTRSGYIRSDAEIVADTLMYAELRGNNQGVV